MTRTTLILMRILYQLLIVIWRNYQSVLKHHGNIGTRLRYMKGLRRKESNQLKCHGTARARDTGAWVGSCLCAVVGASPKGLLRALGAHGSEGTKLLCFSFLVLYATACLSVLRMRVSQPWRPSVANPLLALGAFVRPWLTVACHAAAFVVRHLSSSGDRGRLPRRRPSSIVPRLPTTVAAFHAVAHREPSRRASWSLSWFRTVTSKACKARPY